MQGVVTNAAELRTRLPTRLAAAGHSVPHCSQGYLSAGGKQARGLACSSMLNTLHPRGSSEARPKRPSGRTVISLPGSPVPQKPHALQF